MFAPGDYVGVAVSGGPDSLFLLHALRQLAPRWNLRLAVVHVDHQLRPSSGADAQFVESLAASLGVPFLLDRVEISTPEGGIEQAARNARRDFFHRLLKQGAVNKVATGHTLSDQAETVLLRLLRGAGATGLAGILPHTQEGIVRPLLQIHRGEVERWLREHGFEWRTDETNASREFLRNRVRLDLLPVLRSDFNPNADILLAQTADLSREEECYWQTVVEHAASETFQQLPGPALIASASHLRAQPKALARRLVRHAAATVRGDLRQLDFEHIEAILKLAETAEGHGRVILPGVDVMRSFDWIRFIQPGADHLDSRVQIVPLQVPGDTILPGGRALIRTRISLAPESGYNKVQVDSEHWDRVDWATVNEPLELRFWLPGDHYQPSGRKSAEKIKQLFQDAKVPLWERRFWPIVESSQGIVWTRRFGPSSRHSETSATRQVLEIREIR